MKILEVEKIELRLEKQKDSKNFRWCVYCKVEKSKYSNLIFMIKSKENPFLLFQQNNGNTIIDSKKVEAEILKKDENKKTKFR